MNGLNSRLDYNKSLLPWSVSGPTFAIISTAYQKCRQIQLSWDGVWIWRPQLVGYLQRSWDAEDWRRPILLETWFPASGSDEVSLSQGTSIQSRRTLKHLDVEVPSQWWIYGRRWNTLVVTVVQAIKIPSSVTLNCVHSGLNRTQIGRSCHPREHFSTNHSKPATYLWTKRISRKKPAGGALCLSFIFWASSLYFPHWQFSEFAEGDFWSCFPVREYFDGYLSRAFELWAPACIGRTLFDSWLNLHVDRTTTILLSTCLIEPLIRTIMMEKQSSHSPYLLCQLPKHQTYPGDKRGRWHSTVTPSLQTNMVGPWRRACVGYHCTREHHRMCSSLSRPALVKI